MRHAITTLLLIKINHIMTLDQIQGYQEIILAKVLDVGQVL